MEEGNEKVLRELINELRFSNANSTSIIQAIRDEFPVVHKSFYGIDKAAIKLDVSVDMLQYLTSPKNIVVPFAWLGKNKRFSDADLEKWYVNNRVKTLSEIRAEQILKTAKK